MAKIWGWFPDAEALAGCVQSLSREAKISVAFRRPDSRPDEVLVVGPLTRDLDCYPFLDLLHHIRRFGVTRQIAERYAEALEAGGFLVCVESAYPYVMQVLHRYRARDLVC